MRFQTSNLNFHPRLTPKKTISITWSIFWPSIKSWISWFVRFWYGLNTINIVFFRLNESLLTLNKIDMQHMQFTTKTLFTWSGGPRSSGVGFFCFHALADTKQKKPTPLDRVPQLHVNRPLLTLKYNWHMRYFKNTPVRGWCLEKALTLRTFQ